MNIALRVAGIIASLALACIGWWTLAAVTAHRTETQRAELRGSVNQLWGREHVQQAPTFTFSWVTEREVSRAERRGTEDVLVKETVREPHSEEMAASSGRVRADIELDQRLKGLTWYSLYAVRFHGAWTYLHEAPQAGRLTVALRFPDPESMYDDFRFVVDGKDLAATLRPVEGVVAAVLDVQPGQRVSFETGYSSRGMDAWSYAPGVGVATLRDFQLVLTTDFADIDYPAGAISPSRRERAEGGWTLEWAFTQVVAGRAMGVVMPLRIQPGELASKLAASAPISLLLFFLLVFVLSVLKKLDIHPVNYLALAAAFFSFHLLFAYLADHVRVGVAFAMASATSVFLVVSYLRLVVSPRFAFVHAMLAQLVYQVGFSLAHFWKGFTGLTVSVLAVLTLFVLMQLTGRVRWSEVGRKHALPAPAGK